MKFFCFLILFAGLSAAACFAQSNFKPGYVINLNGDTVRGYVDYREWGTNPEMISFKKSMQDKDNIRFGATEIRFFGIDRIRSYQSYTGPISTDYIDANHVEEVRDTTYVTKTVFLQVIQKGPNIIYYAYTDGIKTRVYFEQMDDHTIKEFVYRLYNTGSPSHTVAENTYMEQLFSLANKYNVLTDGLRIDIEHLYYNTESILEIINKINHTDAKLQAAIRSEQTKKSVFLFAGAGLNVTTTDPKSLYGQNGGKSYTSYLPKASIGINIFTNPDTRQLMFRGEFGVEGIHYSSSYVNKVAPYDNISYSYSNLAITFTPQALYNFYNEATFKIYAGLGLEAALNNYSAEQYVSSAGAGVNTNNPFNFVKGNARLMIKVGFMISNNLSIDFAYLTSGYISNDPYFQLNATPAQIGVNYYFGR